MSQTSIGLSGDVEVTVKIPARKVAILAGKDGELRLTARTGPIGVKMVNGKATVMRRNLVSVTSTSSSDATSVNSHIEVAQAVPAVKGNRPYCVIVPRGTLVWLKTGCWPWSFYRRFQVE